MKSTFSIFIKFTFLKTKQIHWRLWFHFHPGLWCPLVPWIMCLNAILKLTFRPLFLFLRLSIQSLSWPELFSCLISLCLCLYLNITWPRSAVVMVPSPQISNSLNTSWQGPHHSIQLSFPCQGQSGNCITVNTSHELDTGCWWLPCNPQFVSVTSSQWPWKKDYRLKKI